MQNFIFSLNATFPIFLVMLLGYILKNVHMLAEDFVTTANTLNFKVTLPVLLFLDISTANIRDVWDGSYVLFCSGVTTLCFFTIWGLSKLLIKKKELIGAFVQASFRSSAAVLGIAFIQNMYGSSGMAPLMIVGTVPLYNIYSVLVLTFEARRDDEEIDTSRLTSAIKNIITNPIILGILAGLVVSVSGITFPVMVNKTLSSIASLATPLALIALGAGFEGKGALSKIKPTMVASFIKLLLQPAIILPFAIICGFEQEKLVAILIMLASPTTVSCYIMAKNMNNDGTLTSSIIVMTTFLSAFTLTAWIYLLRSIGLI